MTVMSTSGWIEMDRDSIQGDNGPWRSVVTTKLPLETDWPTGGPERWMNLATGAGLWLKPEGSASGGGTWRLYYFPADGTDPYELRLAGCPAPWPSGTIEWSEVHASVVSRVRVMVGLEVLAQPEPPAQPDNPVSNFVDTLFSIFSPKRKS